MDFKKKSLVVSGTLILGVSLVALSGCSSDKNAVANKDIVTMKGDSVKVSDLYKELQTFPNLSSTVLVQNLTFDKILSKDFAKEADDKALTKQVNTLKSQYGDQFSSMLQQSGLTNENLKAYLRTGLLEQAAIDNDIKKTQYTDANLKKAWETYHPDVTAYVAVETSKDAATKALEAAKKDDAGKASFEKTNAEGKVTFNSASTSVPTEVQTAAFKLKNGEFSDVIESTSSSTGATSYYIVEMVKTSEKGTDMNKYKKELQNVIKTEKESDTTYNNSVITKFLKKNNVEVKNKSFSSIFSRYLTSTSQS
jgi:foldase protein PrsA